MNAGADNEAVVKAVVEKAIEKFGHIDVLVNNAQASASGVSLAEHTTEQFDLAMYSELYAAFYYMKACYPYLKRNKRFSYKLRIWCWIIPETKVSALLSCLQRRYPWFNTCFC